ncbi:MAG: hydrogen gas-evolving membrane-bound hydrogenase subunit E, partial [Salinibacter sp.]
MSVIVSTPLNLRLTEYLAQKSYTAAQGHNIVNVILVDFRGFDTMGEITVLTIAALGVYVLMRMPR